MRKDYHFEGFDGFEEPRFTMIPNLFFDELAPHLSEAELRVLLYLMRRTYGFGKTFDAVSVQQMVDGIKTREGDQLDRGTGLSRRGVQTGCAGLVNKGVILVHRERSEAGDNDVNVYRLRFRQGAQQMHPLSALPAIKGGAPSEPRGVQQMHPQKTRVQKKEDVGTEDERTQLWADASTWLRKGMTVLNWQTYYADAQLVALTATQATIAVPTAFQQEWLQGRCRVLVQRALAEAGRPVAVAFVVGR